MKVQYLIKRNQIKVILETKMEKYFFLSMINNHIKIDTMTFLVPCTFYNKKALKNISKKTDI